MTSNCKHSPRGSSDFCFYEGSVEKLRWYCRGGYHPTHLGDIFHNRYKVIHKLGYGSYSVVWLARDLEAHRNVAVKITRAENSSQASMEAKVMRAINAGDKNHPGYSFVSHLLDEFWVDGPNGRHLCLVLRAAGCSITASQGDSDRLPIGVARSLSAQALLGLSYIRSCGVVHGDLHKGNILFEYPELEHYNESDLKDALGEPERWPVLETPDKQPHGPEIPDYCVPVAGTGFAADEAPEDARIIISDFGQSFFATEVRHELQTPPLVAPPEHFFKEHLGPPTDVWTLGMTIYEILSRRCLFDGFPINNEVISEMVNTLGHPPERWWNCWEGKRHYFAEDGSSIGESMPLAERLKEREDEIGDEEQKSLEQLYKGRKSEQGDVLSGGMLEYEPSKRITADEALRSDWVTRWAWPDFKKRVAGQRDNLSLSSGEVSPQSLAFSSFTASGEETSPQTVSTSHTAWSGELSPETAATTYPVEEINDDKDATKRGGLVPDSVGLQDPSDVKDASLSDAANKKISMVSIASDVKDCDGSGSDGNVKHASLGDDSHDGSS